VLYTSYTHTTNNLDCPNVAVGDAAGLALVMDNSTAIGAECFVFNEMFPGGFSPRFGGELTDYSAVAGLCGEFASGLVWDVSTSIGYNDVDFFIRNTVNASLGPDTPTEFDPGAYTQREQNFNIDLAYPVGISWMSSDLSIAGGFEYREEEFEITRGDLASYEIGSPARRDAAL
jgi:iron complex outermembrane recepter protein